MRLIVRNHYTEQERALEGSQSVIASKLLEQFPWLRTGSSKRDSDLAFLLRCLNSAQALDAWVEDDGQLQKAEGNLADGDIDLASPVAIDMIGFNPQVHPAFSAAQFLTGKPEVSLAAIRRSLYETESYIDAAIMAYGLAEGDASRRAIKAVMSMSEQGRQAASAGPGEAPKAQDIEAGTSDAQEAAEALRRAFRLGQVRAAHLDGKHSRGSLIARDGVADRTYLLKPGSGGPGPAAGVAQESASPSRREAAFYRVAEAWGLGESVPRTDLVIIDGREYAAIEMLPFTWKGMQKKLGNDQGVARAALSTYRDRGLLHKWAVLDAVLGNPDRHEDNLMVSEDNRLVGLIDHGSAFAGSDFDPAFDRSSFVPYYLRAWDGPRFNNKARNEKLACMPTVSDQLRRELRDWLDGVHADHLEMLLTRFGIDPAPSVQRLAKVKRMASQEPVDMAINRFWVTV